MVAHTVEEAKDFMRLEETKTDLLAEAGDMNSGFELLRAGFSSNSVEGIKRIMTSGNGLMRHSLMNKGIFYLLDASDSLWEKAWDKTTALFNGEEAAIHDLLLSFIGDGMLSSEPLEFLPVTWYSRGIDAYYLTDEGLERACHFWNKARQTGHPFVLSDLVMIPPRSVVSCEF